MYTINEFCEFAKISKRLFDVLKTQGLGPQLTRVGRRILSLATQRKNGLMNVEPRTQRARSELRQVFNALELISDEANRSNFHNN